MWQSLAVDGGVWRYVIATRWYLYNSKVHFLYIYFLDIISKV